MSSTLRNSAVALCTGALLIGGAGSAFATHDVDQDGLVNVAVGNVNILRDVNLALGAQIAANICGVDVDLLTADVEDDGMVTCTTRNGRQTVTITE